MLSKRVREAEAPIPPAILYLLEHGRIPASGVPGRFAAFRLLHPAHREELRALWSSLRGRTRMSWADAIFNTPNIDN